MVYFHTKIENYFLVCIILEGCVKIGHGISRINFKGKWKLLKREVNGLKCVIFLNKDSKIRERWKADTMNFKWFLTCKYIRSNIIY